MVYAKENKGDYVSNYKLWTHLNVGLMGGFNFLIRDNLHLVILKQNVFLM